MKNGFSADCNLGDIVKKYLDDLTKQLKGVESIDAGIVDNATTEKGIKLEDIIIYNEFGTENIPARSSLRSTLKENKQKYFKNMIRLLQRKHEMKKIGEMLGLTMQRDIVHKIESNITPQNADSTLRAYANWHTKSQSKKGKKKIATGKKTLIWSGQMLKHIKFRVNKKKQ